MSIDASVPVPKQTIKLYGLYHSDDHKSWQQLRHHLAVLHRSKRIEILSNDVILPGSHSADEQKHLLEIADIILLLISKYFNACDICWNAMEQAMDRHKTNDAKVVPIYLTPYYYKWAPYDGLKMLPCNEKPVSLWRDKDKAYAEIVYGIDSIIKEFQIFDPTDAGEELDQWQ